jgi:competence protein ComEC
MLSALIGFEALVTAIFLLISNGLKGQKPLLRCSLCLMAFGCGWILESESGTKVRDASAVPVERELEGRLLALPERDDRDRYLLRLRCGSSTYLLWVAASTEGAGRELERLRTGDEIRVWCRLSRARGYANPGSNDPAIWMRAKGLEALGRVKSARLVELIARGPSGPRRWLAGTKATARERLDDSFGAEGDIRAMLGAMLLGDRAGMAPAQLRALRYAGLVHLVAISGLHAGLLAMLLFGALRRMGIRPGLLFLLALVLLPAFGMLVGGRPPVLRAVVASILILFGRWCGRGGDPVNSLLLIATVFLVSEPSLLLDAGFQLTFIATAGIMLMAPPLASRLPLPAPLALPLSLAAAAYVGCAPLLAHHFGWLAPVSLLSNLAAAPLCAVIILCGYGAILFGWLPPVHDAAALLAELSVTALIRIAGSAATLPFSGWRVPPPGTVFSLAYYLLLGGLVLRRAGRLRPALTMLMLLWLHIGHPPVADGMASAALLDVGQGQSLALRGPDGRVALVDAAGLPASRFDPGERIVLPFLSAWNSRRIEFLAISHGDFDHGGGAFAVIREMELGELWLPPGYHHDALLRELAAEARSRGSALLLAEGATIYKRLAMPIEVLAPSRQDVELEGNDRSLVLRIGRPPCRLLVPGDLERKGESALIASGREIEAEALVLSHHGARGGSGALFLARVHPHLALVSCGFNNRYNHPHPEVRERITERGIPLWRTDRDGMLLLEADAAGWKVSSARSRKRMVPE